MPERIGRAGVRGGISITLQGAEAGGAGAPEKRKSERDGDDRRFPARREAQA